MIEIIFGTVDIHVQCKQINQKVKEKGGEKCHERLKHTHTLWTLEAGWPGLQWHMYRYTCIN